MNYEPFTKKSSWRAADGRLLPLEEIESSHLFNILWLCRQKAKRYNKMSDDHQFAMVQLNECLKLIDVLKDIAEERGYNLKKIAKKQIPFEKNGKWYELDDSLSNFKEVKKPKNLSLKRFLKDPEGHDRYLKNLEEF